jgi:hypothetical protein
MRLRPAGLLLAALLVLAGCGDDQPDEPTAVRFTEVALPAGATPLVLTPVGDTLLIGVRREGQPVAPGLLRRGADGTVSAIAGDPAGRYGEQAYWYSIAADAEQVLAIGGKTGGAHGNVRWSAWTGSDAGIVEKPQPFSTFGGYGAGDLIDAVLTPAGPALVGTWQNPEVGLDIMVWRPDGDYWVRRPSAGTALANERDSLKFPLAATAVAQGILIVGWEFSGGRQRPAAWRSATGDAGWTMIRLPDPGRLGTAVAVRCHDSRCEVAGRVDGKLALWQLDGDSWTRLRDIPRVAVPDDADLPAPIDVEGHPTEILTDGDRVVVAGQEIRPTAGPTGQVTAVAHVGRTVYVAAGDKLWQAELSP